MKFTIALLSLATVAFAAPTGSDSTVAGARVDAALKPIVDGKLSPRSEAGVGVIAAAGASGLGSIPVHAHGRRDDLPDPDLVNIKLKIDALHAIGMKGGMRLKKGKRDVQTLDAVLAPAEATVKALVAPFDSKNVTLAEAKALLPELTSVLVGLKASFDLLQPHFKDISVSLDTDSRHDTALQIAELIDVTVAIVDHFENVFVTDFPELEPAVVTLNHAIQDVIDGAAGLVAGLHLEVIPPLKISTKTLEPLGLHLHVGLVGF